MTAAEFNAALRVLGQTDDQLAAELDVTPIVVRAWATGSTRVPRRYAEHIRWLVAGAERGAALRSSGLPDCEWMLAQEERLDPSDTDALSTHGQAILEHAKACPVCA